MWVLKSKFNMALIIAIILMLSLIAVWYVIPARKVSPLIVSDLEKLDTISTMEGTTGMGGYFFPDWAGYGVPSFPILIIAHVYTTNVTGDNIILRIDANIVRADTTRLRNETAIDLTNPVCTKWNATSEPDVQVFDKKYRIQSWEDIDEDGKLSSSDRVYMNISRLDPRWCDVQEVEYGAICYVTIANESIIELSGNSTYVFNKLTHENVEDAPEANKPRRGYDPFYPSHIKLGEDIPNAWLDNLNETGTFEFVNATKIEDVELYEYFLNKTITKELVIPDFDKRPANYTLTSTKRVLIEPLSGLPVYTKNETFIMLKQRRGMPENPLKLVYLTYKDKELDLVTPRLAHGAMQLLEFDKEARGWILGAIAVILIVAFIFNTRSLYRARKMLPKAKA